MNQFRNQCIRKIGGVRCQNEHIRGHYHCITCITEVEENKITQTVRCNRDIRTSEGRYKCRNQRSRSERVCDACRCEMDLKRRYFPSRFNQDLIIDLQK